MNVPSLAVLLRSLREGETAARVVARPTPVVRVQPASALDDDDDDPALLAPAADAQQQAARTDDDARAGAGNERPSHGIGALAVMPIVPRPDGERVVLSPEAQLLARAMKAAWIPADAHAPQRCAPDDAAALTAHVWIDLPPADPIAAALTACGDRIDCEIAVPAPMAEAARIALPALLDALTGAGLQAAVSLRPVRGAADATLAGGATAADGASPVAHAIAAPRAQAGSATTAPTDARRTPGSLDAACAQWLLWAGRLLGARAAGREELP